MEANAIKEREQETLLEEIVDKLRLARAAKRCKSLEGLLDTYEECDNLSGVTEELKKTQSEIIELLDVFESLNHEDEFRKATEAKMRAKSLLVKATKQAAPPPIPIDTSI